MCVGAVCLVRFALGVSGLTWQRQQASGLGIPRSKCRLLIRSSRPHAVSTRRLIPRTTVPCQQVHVALDDVQGAKPPRH